MSIESFRFAMRSAGLHYSGPIVPDSKLHRIRAEGDKARNSWYVLHTGTPVAGAFGCWKRGIKETWCERKGCLSEGEWSRTQRRWQGMERERELVESERATKARQSAAWICSRGKAVTLHSYLVAKGVKAFGNLKEWRGLLVLPLLDGEGSLQSLQLIAPDKRFDGDRDKTFLTGGRVAGCFFTLSDKPDGPLVIVEGYATGASIHDATNFATVAAMNAGNLLGVAKSLRQKFPAREIIVAGDNDQWTDRNPGLTKAREAALAIGATLAMPQFADVASKPTDFNDLARLAGLAEVKRQIESATRPTEEDGEAFDRIAKLSPADYDRHRSGEAKRLGVRVTTLDAEVNRRRVDVPDECDVSRKRATPTAKLPGLVDLVEADGKVAFLLKEGGGLRVAFTVDTNLEIFEPPPRDKIPFALAKAEEVERWYRSDDDIALFDALEEYHRGTSDLPDGWYLLLAVWVMHGWLLEAVNYSPMIVFFAVTERGKTRTLKASCFVSYRGILTETLRESTLIRDADRFGGCAFFDVTDLWKKVERACSEDIILNRFERGTRTPRVNRPEAGAFRDTDYYEIFGATMIASNEPLYHVLETRCLICNVPEGKRLFPQDVVFGEAEKALRARLMAFRARHLGERLPEAEKPIGGRLGDITRPLVQMLRLVRPEKESELLALIRRLDGDRKSERAESFDGLIVKAVCDCVEEVLADGRLAVRQVADRVNADREKKVTSQSLGRRLRALGFEKGAGTGKGKTIRYDQDLVGRLAKQYGIEMAAQITPRSSATSVAKGAWAETDGSDDPDVFPKEPAELIL